MKRYVSSVLLAVLLMGCAVAAGHTQGAPAASGSNARTEALALFDDAANKIIRLAEAIPAEKYTWRPGEGVRSVSEVLLHVSAGNFNIPRRIGTPPPEGFTPQGFEKSTTDKAKIIETVKNSVEHVRKAYNNVSDADLEKTAPWFGGRQATYREIMFFLAGHTHEHLGQLIAYARMNGVTPPWNEEHQQRQQQPAKRP